MRFDLEKAKYSYQIFTEDGDFLNDVDCVKQIYCNDGCYRFVAFEIKHPNEDMENVYNQVFALRHIIDDSIPIVVAEITPEDTKFIDGCITDKDKAEIGATRTAWVNLNTCVIKYMIDFPLGTSEMYTGLKVDDLLESIRKGENDMDKINQISKPKWYKNLRTSDLCTRF